MSDLRDRVARSLEDMMRPSGALDPVGPNAIDPLDARRHIREDIIAEYLDLAPAPAEGGRIQIVTAGAPGSGKSTALTGVSGYRDIDPDVVKELILARERARGSYDRLLRTNLPDGSPLQLLELAGLVHHESTTIATQIRRRCMGRGENLIVHGTLSWPPLVDVHLGELAAHDYVVLHVVSVDVPFAVALERSRIRWWTARTDLAQPDGGRFIPERVIAGCYDLGGNVCDRNARSLRDGAANVIDGLTATYGTEFLPSVRRVTPPASAAGGS